MKKTIWAVLATAALFAVCCDKEYDDSALVQRINDLEGRVTALEPLNTTVSGISAIVNALSPYQDSRCFPYYRDNLKRLRNNSG